jgi:competence protein ComEA
MRKLMIGLFLGILFLLHGGDALADGRRAGNEGAVAAPAGAPQGVVNINEATAEQLELLPGIGPARARTILDHRKAHPFKRVEELTRIKGIGKKTFARLRPLITLSGPTTLTERPRK